jgi:hypothetical protein
MVVDSEARLSRGKWEAAMQNSNSKRVIDAFASSLMDTGCTGYRYDSIRKRLLMGVWALACETLDYDAESRIVIRRAIHQLQSEGIELDELADDARIQTADDADHNEREYSYADAYGGGDEQLD